MNAQSSKCRTQILRDFGYIPHNGPILRGQNWPNAEQKVEAHYKTHFSEKWHLIRESVK